MEMKCDSHGWVRARHFCHKCVADYLTRIAKLEAEGGLMAEHTQTPWKMVPCRTCSSMGTENAHRCGSFQLACPPANDYEGRFSTADADFLLRAVNCHEELVKALERVMNNCVECGEEDEPCVDCECARAALAKAKEGTVDESQMLLQDLDEETL